MLTLDTTTQPKTVQRDLRERFLVRLAEALHQAGTPAESLEVSMLSSARRLGLHAEFFTTPTSILVRFGEIEEHRTVLLRVHPTDADLERLVLVHEVQQAVLRGEVPLSEAMKRLETVRDRRPRYGPIASVGSFALASLTASRFFGGGSAEMAASAGIGALIGGLAVTTGRWPTIGRIFEPLAAALASFIAVALAALLGGIRPDLVTLGGLIVLVPGLGLTLALSDLAARHLASGTARLFGAVIVFFTIAFGVTLGRQLGALLPAPVLSGEVLLPTWVDVACLAVSPLAFAVLFRARPRDFGWIYLVCAFGQLGGRLGGAWLGPQLGAGLGALAVGIGANLGERLGRRPAPVMALPGLILLVPGSIGYRSLAALLAHDIVPGIESAVTATFVAVSLATGLLIANVALPAVSARASIVPARILSEMER